MIAKLTLHTFLRLVVSAYWDEYLSCVNFQFDMYRPARARARTIGKARLLMILHRRRIAFNRDRNDAWRGAVTNCRTSRQIIWIHAPTRLCYRMIFASIRSRWMYTHVCVARNLELIGHTLSVRYAAQNRAPERSLAHCFAARLIIISLTWKHDGSTRWNRETRRWPSAWK